MERMGYRVVSYDPDTGLQSLYGRDLLDLQIGQNCTAAGRGLFLGTTRAFCESYYSGLTDDADILLTYSYDIEDLLEGDPDAEGEITVRQARLVAAENLSDPSWELQSASCSDDQAPSPS